jgi:transcriptional regulator with XRE-family HTH domain
MQDKKINIGKLILEELKKQGMSKSELARRSFISKQNLNNIFKRETINTMLLLQIGTALNHNFFRYYNSQYLELTNEPCTAKTKKKNTY